MPEKKDENKKKKTLSLKLGAKPKLSPKKNIEALNVVKKDPDGLKGNNIDNNISAPEQSY